MSFSEKRPTGPVICVFSIDLSASSLWLSQYFFLVLLEQVAGTNAEGNNLPLGDAAKELAEAQRMMTEMRNRNFGQLQAEAEKERTEAQLRKGLFS